jgi:hypothetical protein
MTTPSTTEMGRRHEEHTAKVLGGAKTGSSGNQWDDQLDGAHAHDLPFSFRWDNKSTKGKSLAITLEMIAKAVEQAQGDRPAIPLRWYANEKLTEVAADWIAVRDVDFSEVLEAARRCEEAEERLGEANGALRSLDAELTAVHSALGKATEQLRAEQRAAREVAAENVRLRQELEETRFPSIVPVHAASSHDLALEEARGDAASAEVAAQNAGEGLHVLAGKMDIMHSELLAAGRELEAEREVTSRLGRELTAVRADLLLAREAAKVAVPPYVPRLPWTVVHQAASGGRTSLAGLRYDAAGHVTPLEVDTVVVERSIGSANRPRLIVSGVLVPDGDLYADGKLKVRACKDDPSIEVG